MRFVELAGAPGAGKSALAPLIVELLRAHGSAAASFESTVDAAVAASRGRSAVGRRMPASAWRAALELRHQLAFGREHPSLVYAVLRAARAEPLSAPHRRRILRLVFRLAARQRLARSRAAEADWVVVDEGWIQRTVNLFAWCNELDVARVERYLDLIPLPDALLLVTAARETRDARLGVRGLPIRLRGKPEDVRERFLRLSDEVTRYSAAYLERRGVPVLHVANDGPLDAAAREIGSQIRRLDGVGAVFRPAGPMLPKPRRLFRRTGPGLSEDEVSTVLSAWRMAPVGAPRAPAGGRRSTSAVVRTASGTKLLKRYKPEITARVLRDEHLLTLELGRRGFPGPRLVTTPDGATLVECDGRTYALYDFLSGYARASDVLLGRADLAHLTQAAGASLGALHGQLSGVHLAGTNPNGFTAPDGGRVRPLEWYATELDSASATLAREGLEPERRWVWERLVELDVMLARADPPRTVIHGDFGPYNLLVRAGAPIVVVDLELARLDWRLTDLATAIPRFAERRGGWDAGHAARFVAGYRSRCAVDDEELALLPAVLSYLHLRRAIVCWARYARTAAPAWREEASQKLESARAAAAGRHPLAAIR